MNMNDKTYNADTCSEFKLKHWGLVDLGDAVAASGNLHCRPGYPDGVQVQTSVIHSWDLCGDSVVLYTANSVYRCPLREHVISGNSLSLFKAVSSLSGAAAEDLEEAVWNTMENEVVRFRNILTSGLPYRNSMNSVDPCVMYCWEGCDLPYLKQVVVYENGSITVDDLPHIRQGYTNSIALSGSTSISVRSDDEITRHFYSYDNDFSKILIENTGVREIFVRISNQKSIPVPAGGIVRVA